MKHLNAILLVATLVTAPLAIASEESNTTLAHLQHQWATNNYQREDDAQQTAFETLLVSANEALQRFPNNADILIWHGIINSTYAGVTGGLGALKYAKTAKADFEKAIKIDPNALNGSAYTSLGVLYFKVPGWPFGFGDDDKAQALLQQALTINPTGLDSNYFYGEFLREDDQYQQAKSYYEKALAAAPRPERPLADSGRRAEIARALQDVNQHH